MTKRIGIAAVFLVGCAVGGGASQLVVPKASAQQAAELPKWQYKCLVFRDTDGIAERMNRLGDQNWELTTSDQGVACFKRTRM